MNCRAGHILAAVHAVDKAHLNPIKESKVMAIYDEKLHASITTERLEALAREQMFGMSNPGVCTACGSDQDGCEPDAEYYECENCGECKVFGASELFMVFA